MYQFYLNYLVLQYSISQYNSETSLIYFKIVKKWTQKPPFITTYI
jgi:hypothetical protein